MKKISIKWLWFIVIGLWLIAAGAFGYATIKKYTSVDIDDFGYSYKVVDNITELMYVNEEKDLSEIYMDLQMQLEDFEEQIKEVKLNYMDYTLTTENGCLEITENGVKAVKMGRCALFLEKDYKDKQNLKHKDRACIGIYLVIDDTYEGFTKITTPSEFYTLLTENPCGKFMIGNDLDFHNVEYKRIEFFRGILINPYQYKIKNITSTDSFLFRPRGAFIEGLNLENCSFLKDNRSYSILMYEPLDLTMYTILKNSNIDLIVDNGYPRLGLSDFGLLIKNTEINYHIFTTDTPIEIQIEPFGHASFINSKANIAVSGPNKAQVFIESSSRFEGTGSIIIEGKEHELKAGETFRYSFS